MNQKSNDQAQHVAYPENDYQNRTKRDWFVLTGVALRPMTCESDHEQQALEDDEDGDGLTLGDGHKQI